jgi:glycosyltransferase involved in cell wall biosynthesis
MEAREMMPVVRKHVLFPGTAVEIAEQETVALRPQTLASLALPSAPHRAAPRMTGGLVGRRRAARPLRIAMMGSRGIPASYSGFETAVEQLSVRLAARGHAVTVYCRSHHVRWSEPLYRGVQLVKLPTIASKHLDTIVHTFLSMLHGLTRRYDVVYVCGVGNAPLAWLPRLAGVPTVVNVDGADWQRGKWGSAARRYLRFAERAATRTASVLLADSRVVERSYQERFGAASVFIPYGSDVPRLPPAETLARYGLQPGRYLLWVGRLVPENNAHDVIEAYQRLGGPATGYQLCIVGDAPYASAYQRQLKASAGPGVVFTGYVFGQGYHELGSNAHLFVFASGVGGTHPALLEAMAFGNCVIVNDTPANLETVGQAAIPYRGSGGAEELARVLGAALADPQRIAAYRHAAAHRAATVYSWDVITDQYEDLFARLAGAGAVPEAVGVAAGGRG